MRRQTYRLLKLVGPAESAPEQGSAYQRLAKDLAIPWPPLLAQGGGPDITPFGILHYRSVGGGS